MRRLTISAETMTNIANAIRYQTGQSGTMKAGDMAGKIMALEVTGIAVGYNSSAEKLGWVIEKAEVSYNYDAQNSTEVTVE